MNQVILESLRQTLIDKLDFDFLNEIKDRLPYVNVYYLVCLVEVLNRYLNEERDFDSYDTAFRTLTSEAAELYQITNISEYILPLMI